MADTAENWRMTFSRLHNSHFQSKSLTSTTSDIGHFWPLRSARCASELGKIFSRFNLLTDDEVEKYRIEESELEHKG